MKNKQLPDVAVSVCGDVYLAAKAKGCSRWRCGHSMRGPAPTTRQIADGAARLARRVGQGGIVQAWRFNGAAWVCVASARMHLQDPTMTSLVWLAPAY